MIARVLANCWHCCFGCFPTNKKTLKWITSYLSELIVNTEILSLNLMLQSSSFNILVLCCLMLSGCVKWGLVMGHPDGRCQLLINNSVGSNQTPLTCLSMCVLYWIRIWEVVSRVLSVTISFVLKLPDKGSGQCLRIAALRAKSHARATFIDTDEVLLQLTAVILTDLSIIWPGNSTSNYSYCQKQQFKTNPHHMVSLWMWYHQMTVHWTRTVRSNHIALHSRRVAYCTNFEI